MAWERPSERVRELIRRGAGTIVNGSQELLDRMYDAMLDSGYLETIADDPVLAESMRRCNRANQLHWAAANISHPGEPVPVNLGTETLTFIRDLLRRSLDESAAVDAYRIGQNIAWRGWMETTFALTSEPKELRELLRASERSITSFIDATVAGIHQRMQTERDELISGTHAERRQVVALILDGSPITVQRAEQQLGYRLQQSHTAAVVWGDESGTQQSDLDRAVETLTHTVDGRRPLSVLASAATRWVWVPGAEGLDLVKITAAVRHLPGVRIAAGATAAGIDGFRTSHIDAVTTQRMMARLRSTQRVASFADVELVALITSDPERANRFIKDTLGDFESAEPDLQQTVLTFVREQCNASRTAELLFTHRSTLLRRLSRADELLPRPLEANSAHVAVALEALSWRGAAQRARGERAHLRHGSRTSNPAIG